MSEHSIFPPSAMYRLITCPASWRETQSRPEEPQSEYAAHGSMLHEFVPRAYKEGKHIVQELEEREDRSYVLDCVEYLQMLIASCNGLHELKFESKVTLERFGLAEVWGTADITLIDHYNKHVHVIDWKFGSGVQVFAEQNEQCMTYAAGTLTKALMDYDYTIHIVQPPLSYEGTFQTTAKELASFVENVIKRAVAEAKSKSPSYGPSKKACQFCPARFDCIARYKQGLNKAKEVFKMHNKLPKVTPEEIANVLDLIPELKQFIKDIQVVAQQKLQNGTPIPGYKMVHGKGSREWVDEKQLVKWLLSETELEADDLYKSQLKSPAQIEKLDSTLKKDKDFIKHYRKLKGNAIMVDESDPREAIKPEVEAAKVFTAFKPKDENASNALV